MIRRPPRSTLFPSTTLSRSLIEPPQLPRPNGSRLSCGRLARQRKVVGRSPCPARSTTLRFHERSEEHTSELQSRLHLVCRLLLEKKKKQKHSTRARHTPGRA